MLQGLLSFLVSNNLVELSWLLFFWMVLGAVAGGVLGALTYGLLPRRFPWWRLGLAGLNVLALALAGAYLGLHEGAWRGARDTARRSVLIGDINARAGKVQAVFLAGVFHASRILREDPQVTPGAAAQRLGERLDAFMTGQAQLPAAELRPQVEGAGREVVDQVIAVAEEKAVAWIPGLQGSFVQGLLHRGLQELGQALVQDPARAGLRQIRVDAYLARVLANVPEEAARTAPTEDLSFPELTACFAREGVLPWLLDVVRSYVRLHQLVALALAACVVLLPLGVCWLAAAGTPPAQGGPLAT